MKEITFYVNLLYGESRHARVNRRQTVEKRLLAANIPFTKDHYDLGGSIYHITAISLPKNISRLVTVLESFD